MPQRVNMDLDKKIWKQVGIKCIELNMQKKDFVELALKELLKTGGIKMKIVNVKEFEDFINNKTKAETINMDEFKKDLIKRAEEGHENYELGSHETKSGRPENIAFERSFNYNEELDELSNDKITF